MSDPANAVDGAPGTSWRPGPNGRMVVGLGSVQQLGTVTLSWTGRRVPQATVSTSTDGITYQAVPTAEPSRTPVSTLILGAQARYLAVAVVDWPADGASLASVSVTS